MAKRFYNGKRSMFGDLSKGFCNMSENVVFEKWPNSVPAFKSVKLPDLFEGVSDQMLKDRQTLSRANKIRKI